MQYIHYVLRKKLRRYNEGLAWLIGLGHSMPAGCVLWAQ